MNTDAPIILDQAGIDQSLDAMARAIASSRAGEPLALVGLLSKGDIIAYRLADRLRTLGLDVLCGDIDISLYRDDIYTLEAHPSLRSSNLPFSTDGMRLVLVDDVLYTGRTVRAALNAIFDYGRPARVELACLIDRGGREVPIQPDYVGHTLSEPEQKIKVHLCESEGFDAVTIG